MTLTDIIKRVVEDSDKRKNTPETWKVLKNKLKKSGYPCKGKEYDGVMEEISTVGAYDFLQVWEALDKYINKNGNKWGGKENLREQNITMIKKLCEIDNIEEIIKTIGEMDYDTLLTYSGDVYTYVHLSEDTIRTFEMLAEDNRYKKYALIFKALKKLGYKDIRSYDTSSSTQLDYLVEISKADGDAAGAIYALASNGYQIDQFIGVSKIDIKNIKQVIEEAQNEKGGIPVYLYEKGNLEIFQDYFNNLNREDKKSAINLILEHEAKEPSEGMEDIQKWLTENHNEILTEVGFS